ncbi:MAG TPA: MFS transporter [Thermoleophilaceae bacterium]|nr:MFS transporter [Thermoleophilaceae bacterium]
MRPAVIALSLAVGVVLADSAVVTLALPDILRQYETTVGGVSWVLTTFNLVLALAAVPAARLCVRRDPGALGAVGLVVFAACCAVCAAAPSLGVLLAGRVGQALGGAVVIASCLELLVAATGSEPRGAARWAGAGVAGAALGPVAGGLLTQAISWQSIFIFQVPVVLAAVPAALALRGRAGRDHDPSLPSDRPHLAANAALALISAALTAALFLLVLLLVEGWQRSPAQAALIVTVIPVAALAAGPLARAARAGTRSEAVAGAIAVAGGLAALALLPGAEAVWTLAPQALVGLGLGLTIDSLTAVALRDRVPRALHGGWTIAARHGGIVVGLLILTPVFTADLRDARAPAQEAIAAQVLDSRLPASSKLALAEGLGEQLADEGGRVPDLAPAFSAADLPAAQAARAAALERGLDDQLERAATGAFRDAFLLAGLLALLAVVPALFLRGRGER